MTDRVYPSSKPATNGGTTTASGIPSTKSQLNNATRPAYRPRPPQRRRNRGSCCCCFWTIFFVLFLLLAAIATTVLWFFYRPHGPDFSLSSFKISQFNLTSSSQLSSKFNLTVTARNPNQKLIFLYEPFTVSVTIDGVDVGGGSFPAFVHGKKNTTTLTTTVIKSGQSMDSNSVSELKSDMKNKNSLQLKVQLDTKVRVKIESLKTMRVVLRVSCDGITAAVPTGKKATTATISDAKCKVDFRIKIWKWTI